MLPNDLFLPCALISGGSNLFQNHLVVQAEKVKKIFLANEDRSLWESTALGPQKAEPTAAASRNVLIATGVADPDFCSPM